MTTKAKRGNARVCGPDYMLIRPGEYEPFTFIDGECVVCGDEHAAVHRVSWDEVDSYKTDIARQERLKEVRT